MANIVILGAGVMGSALACPPSTYAQNKVTLVGSPLDDSVVDSIQTNHHHPNLKLSLPSAIETIKLDELTSAVLQKADVIVIGVSSSGIDWVCDYLLGQQANPPILALVTKGLVSNPDSAAPPLTYADALNNKLPQIAGRIVGIGGPCIARELALGYPTRVSFAASHQSLANQLREYFQTDTYRINTRTDIVELEACAALKNFICIGVSAMLSAHPLNDSHAKNPLAALFNQAVREIYILSRWIAAAAQLSEVQSNTAQSNTNSIDAKVPDIPAAFDLAGLGDLHVTVGGGRNSRLGSYLGEGFRLSHILAQQMAGDTVEGVDTGKNLESAFHAALKNKDLPSGQLPLTHAILKCISSDSLFEFDFSSLPT